MLGAARDLPGAEPDSSSSSPAPGAAKLPRGINGKDALDGLSNRR